MSEPRSGYFTSGGLRLHYLDWGGSGAPIVILHATGMLGRVYRPIAERLRAVGHVLSLDQRGHGDSQRPPLEACDWHATLGDLRTFVQQIAPSGVRGFGHSSGATAIGALAGERPDLISSAVLVEPVLFESPEGPELGWRNPFIDRTLKRRRVFNDLEAALKNFHGKPPFATWRKDILREYCQYGTRQTADGKLELKCAPEIEARFYETVRDFDGLDRLLRCEVRLLVMVGQRGDSLGAVFSNRLKAGLKNARVIDFPKAGHFLPLEFPDEVAGLADEFFRRQESGAP